MKVLNNDFLGESLYYKKGSSGLDMYILPKKGYARKHAYFVTQYGSVHNEFIVQDKHYKMPLGIAHFLEHKIFENAEINVFQEFAALSGSVNASTSFGYTQYFFNCTEKFEENMKLLMKFVQTPNITEENVEKEKGIIGQEIKMYEDNPDWVHYYSLLKSLFEEHPVRYDIGGTVHSIQEITKEQLDICYKAFYTPSNMFVLVLGDVPIHETFNLIENSLSIPFKKSNQIVSRTSPYENPRVNFRQYEDDFAVPISRFYLGVKDLQSGQSGKELLRKSIVTKFMLDLLFSTSADLYADLFKTGRINSTFSYDYSYELDYGYTVIGGESDDPDETAAYILAKIKTLKESGLDENHFDILKKKAIGRYLNAFSSLDYIGSSFVQLINKGINPFNYYELLVEIQFSEVVSRLKASFLEDYTSLAIMRKKSES
jgi:predicted Zn-dependent peptidase